MPNLDAFFAHGFFSHAFAHIVEDAIQVKEEGIEWCGALFTRNTEDINHHFLQPREEEVDAHDSVQTKPFDFLNAFFRSDEHGDVDIVEQKCPCEANA